MKYKKLSVVSCKLSVKRIIDVNVNRATEGIRVVEEICRFVLDNKDLAKRLKDIRAFISREARDLSARDSSSDVGRKVLTKKEAQRKNLFDVFLANIKRAEEAVRCLEEFSKLLNPKTVAKYKEVRYQLYDLEKNIEKALKLDFDLYVVTDPSFDHLKVAKKSFARGVRMLQLRDKTANKKQILKWSKQISKLAKKYGATFIVNDFWDIANKVSADGIHLGQEDLKTISLKQVRKKLGDKLIGVSTHSLAQAIAAQKAGADYISCGPIFKTPSKPLGKPLGLKVLKQVLRKVKVPVVAIGGIDQSNVNKIRQAGCQRFAAIRAAKNLSG